MTPFRKAFASVPGQTIPDQNVSLKVAINECHCDAPAWLKKQEGKLIRLSLPEIVWAGTVHWTNTVLVPLTDEHNDLQTRMRYVTEDLRRVSPRAESVGTRRVLVVADIGNSDENSRATFVLGNSIGVAVAKRLLRVSYAAFTRRDFSPLVFHDYDIDTKTRKIKLEVRGRFGACGKSTAIEQVKDKFDKAHDFSQSLGILVYPSDDPNRSHPDVEILDPTQDAKSPHPGDIAKRILTHYQEFFTAQKVAISDDIARALEYPHADLWQRLNAGELLFRVSKKKPLPIAYFGRKSAVIGGTRYFGTDYQRWKTPAWRPESFNPQHTSGVLFWGISEHVIQALNSPRILDLLEGSGQSRAHITEGGTEIVLLDDGIVIGWAPNRDAFPRELV